MKEFITKYGVLKDISTIDFYSNGSIKECKLSEYNEIVTPNGNFVPLYEENEVRKKFINSLSFYENGDLKSVALNNQTDINSPKGIFPGELILFYPGDKIKRIFPLNGKITGYWTEENEFGLAQKFDFDFSFAKFSKKIIGILFHESGEIKSLTFWPRDTINIDSPIGAAIGRIGISIYKGGQLKSYEPYRPAIVSTPIGDISAYDASASGINGDINSFIFYGNGKIKSLVTSSDYVEVTDEYGIKTTFKPDLNPNLFNNTIIDLAPMKIEFYEDCVRFKGKSENEYNIDKCSFKIEKFNRN